MQEDQSSKTNNCMQKEIKSDIQSKESERDNTATSNTVSPPLMLSIGSWKCSKITYSKTNFTDG